MRAVHPHIGVKPRVTVSVAEREMRAVRAVDQQKTVVFFNDIAIPCERRDIAVIVGRGHEHRRNVGVVGHQLFDNFRVGGLQNSLALLALNYQRFEPEKLARVPYALVGISENYYLVPSFGRAICHSQHAARRAVGGNIAFARAQNFRNFGLRRFDNAVGTVEVVRPRKLGHVEHCGREFRFEITVRLVPRHVERLQVLGVFFQLGIDSIFVHKSPS